MNTGIEQGPNVTRDQPADALSTRRAPDGQTLRVVDQRSRYRVIGVAKERLLDASEPGGPSDGKIERRLNQALFDQAPADPLGGQRNLGHLRVVIVRERHVEGPPSLHGSLE